MYEELRPAPLGELARYKALRPLASAAADSGLTWEIDWLVEQDRKWAMRLLEQFRSCTCSDVDDKRLANDLRQLTANEPLARILAAAQARKSELTGSER